MTRSFTIGFSQRLQFAWLERAGRLALAGLDEKAGRACLRQELHEQISAGNNADRNNREKAITQLVRIWLRPTDKPPGFGAEGLHHLARLPDAQRVASHWGMTICTYPFVSTVAGIVGRLASLQGSVSAAQIQARVRSQLGERETVSRAARRVLRSFIDWSVLLETPRPGTYRAAETMQIEDRALATWLVEAALWAGAAETLPLLQATHLPALFPFQLPNLSSADIASNPRLELYRQGFDMDMILLRKPVTSTQRR